MVAAAIAAAAALASAGAGIYGVSSANVGKQQQMALAQQQLDQAQQNEQYQRAVQAMVNQRSVAGTQDSFGTTVQYDPVTNTWKQQLGQLPMAADTASINANMVRNSTDLMQQELANRVAMQKAAEAGPYADTAQRELANFRPMSGADLTSLLTQQGINAQSQVYNPLIADTLRQLARTGTAAGPVLAQLGLSEGKNLRNTLIDAQIQGLQNAGTINNANYQRLANAAATGRSLATPQLQQGNLGTSAVDQLLQQLTGTRAQWAPTSTAGGMMGANYGTIAGNQAAGQAIANVAPTGQGAAQAATAFGDLSKLAGGVNSDSFKSLVNSGWNWLTGKQSSPTGGASPAGSSTPLIGYTTPASGTDTSQASPGADQASANAFWSMVGGLGAPDVSGATNTNQLPSGDTQF